MIFTPGYKRSLYTAAERGVYLPARLAMFARKTVFTQAVCFSY